LTASDAASIAEHRVKKLGILLTGVFMPGLRGPELARLVAPHHPGVHVVHVSGYAEGRLEMQLPPNSTFLAKAISVCNSPGAA